MKNNAKLRIKAKVLDIGEVLHTPELLDAREEVLDEAREEVLDKATEEVGGGAGFHHGGGGR